MRKDFLLKENEVYIATKAQKN